MMAALFLLIFGPITLLLTFSVIVNLVYTILALKHTTKPENMEDDGTVIVGKRGV